MKSCIVSVTVSQEELACYLGCPVWIRCGSYLESHIPDREIPLLKVKRTKRIAFRLSEPMERDEIRRRLIYAASQFWR